MRYTVRPLSDRTWLNRLPKKPSLFSAGWDDTLSLLGYEIDQLKGRNVAFEIDVRDADLKLNGELRANARPPETNAVRIAFESAHGPLLYECDRYTTYAYQGPAWQHNIRAIALTLERFRDVERYGTIKSGQQYVGFKAIGSGRAMGAGVSSETDPELAKARILALAGVATWPLNDDGIDRVVKAAKRSAHPDTNAGDSTEWVELADALAALRLS